MWMTHWDRSIPEPDAEALLVRCFETGAQTLGFATNPSEGVLLKDAGYWLRSTHASTVRNDKIRLANLNGLGEISSNQTKLIAMLLYLQAQTAKAGGELILTFCDSEETEEIKWSSNGDLINQLSDLGFCRDTLWQQAEAMGVCEARIDLSLANIQGADGFYF